MSRMLTRRKANIQNETENCKALLASDQKCGMANKGECLNVLLSAIRIAHCVMPSILTSASSSMVDTNNEIQDVRHHDHAQTKRSRSRNALANIY